MEYVMGWRWFYAYLQGRPKATPNLYLPRLRNHDCIQSKAQGELDLLDEFWAEDICSSPFLNIQCREQLVLLRASPTGTGHL